MASRTRRYYSLACRFPALEHGRVHLRALSPNLRSYQQTVREGEPDWPLFRLCNRHCLGPVAARKAETCSRRLAFSARSCSNSLVAREGADTVAIEGVATTKILSAMVANSSRGTLSLADAKTILTLCWRQNAIK